MSLNFYCFRCGHRVSLPDEYRDRNIFCPNCGENILSPPNESGPGAGFSTPQPVLRRVEPSEPIPSSFTISSLLEDSWNLGLKCWQPFLILGAIVGGLTFFLCMGAYLCLIIPCFTVMPMVVAHDQDRIRVNMAVSEFENQLNTLKRERDHLADSLTLHEQTLEQLKDNSSAKEKEQKDTLNREKTELSAEIERIEKNMNDCNDSLAKHRQESMQIASKAGGFSIKLWIIYLSFIVTAFLIASLVLVWLYGGEVAYCLAVVRGEQPSISMLFSGLKYFWRILVVGANITVIALCVDFIIFLVTFLLPIYYLLSHENSTDLEGFLSGFSIVFGIVMIVLFNLILAMVFSLSNFFVVDRNQGAVEAMRSSFRFVWARFWLVFGSILLILVLCMGIGMIPLVGFFLATPATLCLYTVLYLKITGQEHGLSLPPTQDALHG